MSLPEPVPPVIAKAYAALTEERQAKFDLAFKGGVPAELLATFLTTAASPVSASSIRTYRRAINLAAYSASEAR